MYFIFVFLLFWTCLSTAAAWVHPGVPFTKADLAELKTNVAREPWKSAFAELEADQHASLSYEMRGPFAVVTRSPHLHRNEWMSDMQAVHHLTFMWVFSGKEAYAQKATEILAAWSVTNTSWGGDEAILDLGDWVQCYATAADLLKAGYPGWTETNTKHVRKYFAEVLWPTLDVPRPVRGANQGADAIKAAVGIAAFLDDDEKWKAALGSLRDDPAGGLANTLSNGEVGDSGRDEGHTAGQIWNLAWAAEVAWKQGVDIFADRENRLHTVGELYARINLEPGSVPFISFGNPYALYTEKFGWSNGARRKTPLYNILQNAYVNRKGIKAPQIEKLREATGENTETFLFRKTSDSSTAATLPPLIHPTATPVDRLESADIGDVKTAGTISLADGIWTIQGAGGLAVPSSQEDRFQFAYGQRQGDAVMIVKVLTLQGGAADARVGLTIRESLAPDARQVSLYLTANDGAKTTWRGATAFCKTDTSWDIATQTPRNYEEHAGPRAPYWLKLERIGDRVAVYHSPDAINWCCLENVELPLPDVAYLGICVSSQSPEALTTATLSDVTMTEGGFPSSN